MYERRLRAFWILLLLMSVALLARLVDIQVLDARAYDLLAEQRMTRPAHYLRAPRGAIRDRNGEPLVEDIPASDISVHYAVLSGECGEYFSQLARRLRSAGKYPRTAPTEEIIADLHLKTDETWKRISELSGTPVVELLEQADRIRERVERIKDAVAFRTGRRQRVAEENAWHPLVEGIDNELALSARIELEQYPWVTVVPGSARVAHDADAFVHVLGRLGSASAARIDADPLADDELRGLRPGDQCGVSGVERAADEILRGARGRVITDFARDEIERIEPAQGQDVYLTIDATAQRRTVELLGQAVRESENPAGGAAVVIDVETGDVLVLASYPVYPFENFHDEYDALRRDAVRMPLVGRALRGLYPPGSTCKAATLIGGLTDGLVMAQTRIHCTGYLSADMPNAFRCWIYNQYPGVTHDMTGDPAGQSASDAVKNSCNIYFYKVGQLLGPERLCEWFYRLGLGRSQGTGLIEESPGILPTAAWLANRNPPRAYQPSDAWNFSIGQGEVTATPLQAANVAAAVARGQWRSVTLVRDRLGGRIGPAPEAGEGLDEAALRVLRDGMWRVVNEAHGTAEVAKLNTPGYEICGKTGSAQTMPRPLRRRWVLEWPDGHREDVIAGLNEDDVLAAFDEPGPRVAGYRTVERFPSWAAGDKLPSHAWFIGYTQRTGTPRGNRPRGKVYAIGVIIEFGSSGGKVAGPVAQQIADLLLQSAPEAGEMHGAVN